MLRLLCFLLFLTVFKTQAQALEIIENFCDCQPLLHSPILLNNQLLYIENVAHPEEEDRPYDLHVKTLQKKDQDWALVSDKRLHIHNTALSKEEFQRGFEDYIDNVEAIEHHHQLQYLSLSSTAYVFGVWSLERVGTAYQGLHEVVFLFQDLTKGASPLLYYYQHSDYEESYILRSSDPTVPAKEPFLAFCKAFIAKELTPKEPPLYIAKKEVFRWRRNNPKIFDNLQKKDTAAIVFSSYDSVNFYNRYKAYFLNSEIESDLYKAYTGFKSPVFVYDKKRDKSLLVFIPDAWPNGGAWGIRSFRTAALKQHKLYLASPDIRYVIDLEHQRITRQREIPH